MELKADQALWLLTAHPENWDLMEAPAWLSQECAALGLVFEVQPGLWRKTVKGHRAIQLQTGEPV